MDLSEISEGDTVIAPNGDVLEVIRTEDKGSYVKLHVTTDGLNRGAIALDHVVPASSPIRVKISRECYAESLAALAEECGFGTGELSPNIREPHYPFVVVIGDGEDHKVEGKYVKYMDCLGESVGHYDLTYRDDLPQIEGWLEYHRESEGDECETCGDTGQVDFAEDEPVDYEVMVDCPNCSDESEEYDDPKPEEIQRVHWRRTPDEVQDYIHNLESELQDCWENQQEYKNDVAELQVKLHKLKVREKAHKFRVEELEQELQGVREERDRCHNGIKNCHERWQEEFNRRQRLQERIEEAREALQAHQQYKTKGDDYLEEALEILSPDSDEGND